MALLDGIDQVDWSTLHHAYGPAEDVPDLLRALAFPEKSAASVRDAAQAAGRSGFDQVCSTLWSNVYHQGTVWQVTAHVVPFLVEILREGRRDAALQRFLLSYLHHVALGYPEDSFPTRVDPDRLFADVHGKVARPGEPNYEDDDIDLEMGVYARDCYEAVERALPDLAPLCDAEDEATALEAITLLASFPRRAGEHIPALRAIARRGEGPRAAHALVSLAQLAGADALADAAALLDAADQGVAVHAACATALADASQLPPRALTLLLTPLDDAKQRRSVHAVTLRNLVGRCLALVRGEHRGQAIDAVAAQHRDANVMERLSLSESLLELAFPSGRAPAEASELTPEQRRALVAIRDHGGWKVGDSLFTNYSMLMRNWGLPGAQETLAAWLAA